MCLFSKRMDRGRFVWPVTATGTVALTAAQLSMLLEGTDWRRPERAWRPSLAADKGRITAGFAGLIRIDPLYPYRVGCGCLHP